VVHQIDPLLHVEKPEAFPDRRVLYFVDGLRFLPPVVPNEVLESVERGKVAASYVAVLVDRGANYGAAVIAVPARIIRSATEE
jgi:hypothetical protein